MKQDKQATGVHDAGKVLYFTSDNLVFFDEASALAHTEFLADKTITQKTREELEADLEVIACTGAECAYDPLDELDAE